MGSRHSQVKLLETIGIDVLVGRRLLQLLPLLELGLGAWLLTGIGVAGALITSTLLLAAFTWVLVLAIQAGYEGPCSCFGNRGKRPIGLADVVSNVILIVIVLVVNVPTGSREGGSVLAVDSIEMSITIASAMWLGAIRIMVREMESFHIRQKKGRKKTGSSGFVVGHGASSRPPQWK